MRASTFPLASWNRVGDYFQDRLCAIQLCFDQGAPEACLTLVYSGIDTFGFLGAPAGVSKATRTSFLTWADACLVGRLKDIQGGPVTAMDLYAARCGILHTSTSESDLGNRGDAHEIFYRYREHQAIRLPVLLRSDFISIEIEHLCSTFEEGALLFIEGLQGDPDRAQLAKSRAEGFMRWGVPVTE
jgi:hypothetical protein